MLSLVNGGSENMKWVQARMVRWQASRNTRDALLQQIILVTLVTLLSVGCADIALIDGSGTSTVALPPTQPLPGAAGIGDRYFAELGNGGYDVEHYAIVLDV
jgi:hypothetical protein